MASAMLSHIYMYCYSAESMRNWSVLWRDHCKTWDGGIHTC